MLDNTGEPESDPVLGELSPFDPQAETDRAFLHFLRADLVACRVYTPEGRCEDKISRTDEMAEMPEVVDALRQEADLAIIVPELPVLSFHDAP